MKPKLSKVDYRNWFPRLERSGGERVEYGSTWAYTRDTLDVEWKGTVQVTVGEEEWESEEDEIEEALSDQPYFIDGRRLVVTKWKVVQRFPGWVWIEVEDVEVD